MVGDPSLAVDQTYRKVRGILAKLEEPSVAELTRLRILVKAFETQGFDKVTTKDFEELFQEVDAVDPKLKHGNFRMRDWLLRDIGIGCADSDLITRCRKSIKNTLIKSWLNLHVEELQDDGSRVMKKKTETKGKRSSKSTAEPSRGKKKTIAPKKISKKKNLPKKKKK